MLGKFTRKDFLDAVFSHYYRDHRGFVLVKTVKTGDEKVATRYFPNVEVLNKESYGDDRDVFFGICPRERMRPEKEHVKYVLALWADINIGREGYQKGEPVFPGPEEAAKAIRDFPRPPSITVDSGHGLHLYWLLEKPVEVSRPPDVEQILEHIQERLSCKKNSGLDALMRLPDTLNNKVFGQPQKCHTKFINTNFRYSLEELDLSTKAFPSAELPHADLRTPEPKHLPGEGLTGLATEFDKQHAADPVTELERTSPGAVDFGAFESGGTESQYQLAGAVSELESSMPGGGKIDQAMLQEASLPVGPEDWRKTSSGPDGLQKLLGGGKSVELALAGTDRILQGDLEWVEKGWIGIREGEFQYVIPFGSILYIRSRD